MKQPDSIETVRSKLASTQAMLSRARAKNKWWKLHYEKLEVKLTKPRKPHPTKFDHDLIFKHLTAGMSHREIASIVGCSHKLVGKVKKKYRLRVLV